VRKACDEGALTAARRILEGQHAPQGNNRVRVDENLLVRPSSEACV
jgi:hypothetical protein